MNRSDLHLQATREEAGDASQFEPIWLDRAVSVAVRHRPRWRSRIVVVAAFTVVVAVPAAAVVTGVAPDPWRVSSVDATRAGLSLNPNQLGRSVSWREYVDRVVFGSVSVPESSHVEAERSLVAEAVPGTLPRIIAETDGVYLGFYLLAGVPTKGNVRDFIVFQTPGGGRAYDLPFLGPDSIGKRDAVLQPTLLCDGKRPVRTIYIGVVPDAVASVDVTLRHGAVVHPPVSANAFSMSVAPDAVEHTTGRASDGSVVFDTPLDKPYIAHQNGKWPKRVLGETTDTQLLGYCSPTK